MKLTNLLGGLFLSLCLSTMYSCDNNNESGGDVIWDFAGHNIAVQVKNAEGEDLLNPETVGCIADNGIKAIYKDKVYEKDSTLNSPRTRYYMPYWSGLYTFKYDSRYYLNFGEFTPCNNYHNEKYVIDWNDGTKDTVSFDLYITWKKDDPTVHKNVYLNGKKIEGELVIVK